MSGACRTVTDQAALSAMLNENYVNTGLHTMAPVECMHTRDRVLKNPKPYVRYYPKF